MRFPCAVGDEMVAYETWPLMRWTDPLRSEEILDYLRDGIPGAMMREERGAGACHLVVGYHDEPGANRLRWVLEFPAEPLLPFVTAHFLRHDSSSDRYVIARVPIGAGVGDERPPGWLKYMNEHADVPVGLLLYFPHNMHALYELWHMHIIFPLQLRTEFPRLRELLLRRFGRDAAVRQFLEQWLPEMDILDWRKQYSWYRDQIRGRVDPQEYWEYPGYGVDDYEVMGDDNDS